MKKYLLLFLTFGFIQTAISQWSSDPTANLQVTTRGLQPQLITDDAGGAFIVYKDLPMEVVNLYVQRLNKYGYKVFPGNGVALTDTNHTQAGYFFISKDNNGGVFVVFDNADYFDNTYSRRTYVQRVDSSGNKLWGPNGIAVSPQMDKRIMAISMCSDGKDGCYVFWKFMNDRNHVDLWAQYLDGQGNFRWDSSGVLITNQFISHEWPVPCLTAIDENGGFICHFVDSTGAKLQRINSNGEFLWGKGVSIFQKLGWFPNMKSDGFGGVIIAGSYRSDEDDGSGTLYSVGVQRVDQDGHILWGDKGLIVTDLAHYTTHKPEIAIDNFGNTVVIWQDCRSGYSDIYAQKLNSAGKIQWQNNGTQICSVESEKYLQEAVIANDKSTGETIIIWCDFRACVEPIFWVGVTINGQCINSEGNSIWSSDKLISSYQPMKWWRVISDGNGGAIVCWDGKNMERGIWAQQISHNGNLGEVLKSTIIQNVNQTEVKKTKLFRGYPNPFNSQVILKYYIPQNIKVKITIYDIYGREVKQLVNQWQHQGEYCITWNGQDTNQNCLASGVYLVQFRINRFTDTQKIVFVK